MSAPLTVVVVDDEPLARRRLVRLLEQSAGVRLIGVYDALAEAATNIRLLLPDLVMLDVRLRGQDGFDLLRTLDALPRRPAVVLVTAFADRALEAFDSGVVDYLLKPFDDARFALALERARRAATTTAAADPPRSPSSMSPSGSQGPRLLIRDGGVTRIVAARDVEYVRAERRHVRVRVHEREFVVRHALAAVRHRLRDGAFAQIHRSTLVNVEHVTAIERREHGDAHVTLRSGTRLPVSRRYRDQLEALLVR